MTTDVEHEEVVSDSGLLGLSGFGPGPLLPKSSGPSPGGGPGGLGSIGSSHPPKPTQLM